MAIDVQRTEIYKKAFQRKTNRPLAWVSPSPKVRQTDNTENITFPQTMYVGIKYLKSSSQANKMMVSTLKLTLLLEVEGSQNTVLLASTQAVYKAPHSTVRETVRRQTHVRSFEQQ